MNFKTTIILLVLLAGAGVAFYFTNKSAPTADQTTQSTDTTAAKKLLTINPSDVERLVIQPASGKQIVLKREGLNWQMLEPIDAPAEMNPPSEILSDLEAMASTGHVSASGADATATGLSPPQFKLELVTKDGHSTKLDIGSRSGTGDQLYVHLDGAAQDDLVQADIYDLLDKSASDFRRKKLLDVNTAEVQQVEVDRPEGKLTLEKFGSNWFIKQPNALPMPGDNTAISDLVMGLSGLTANDFVSETDPNPRRYGLDNPSIQVSFSNAAPTSQPTTQATTDGSMTTVKFGMLDVRKQYAYVSTSDSTSVARVPVSSMDTFKKTALDLRNKDVLNVDPSEVSKITLETILPATTQPTTRPASDTTVTIERRPIAATQPTTLPSLASTAPSTGPTTGPATNVATTAPAKHSIWQVTSGNPAADAGDGKVDTLLGALHPLRVTQYNAVPTTTPATADRYVVTIEAPPPLISNFKFELTDPGNSSPLIGRYNDLTFELDRALLDKIKADFTKPDDASSIPTGAAATPGFPPTGAPAGPPTGTPGP